jgi:hypothetical protein
MAGIKSPTKGITGYGMLGNQIMFILLDRIIRGDSEVISIGEIATALDVTETEIKNSMFELYQLGKIDIPGGFDYDLSGFRVTGACATVELSQNGLPGTSESSADPAPSLDDLLEEDNLVVECGVETVPIDDGDDSYDQPITFRIGLVEGQEDDTLELSVVRSVDDLHIGESFEVEGALGKWAKVVEQKVFGPGDPAELRGEAVAFVKEMLEAYNPTDLQRRILGLPAIEVSEGDSGGPLTLEDSSEEDGPPQEAAS